MKLERMAGFNARVNLIAVIIALFIAGQPVIAQTPDKQAAAPVKLEVADGTRVTYRVREQLAGLNFPDDAVGTTDAVTGAIVILPDGSIDSDHSKLTIDLRTLKSDQDLRDGYVKNRTFETDKYPNAEFVPRKLQGVPVPLPAPERPAQSGFQLMGDLTIHGVTKPVTLTGYATYGKDLVAGRAATDFTFSTFGLPKPTLARLLSVDDKIQLEIEFRFKRD